MQAWPLPALVKSDPPTRSRDLAVLFGFSAWLLYTRFFWTLQPLHVTLPGCPFLALTGHPCPFCGGTRSFAFMWQGDVVHAARMYPLGPFLFVATLAGIGYAAWALLTRRTLRLRLDQRQSRWALAAVGGVLALSWGAKLFWLGN